MLNKTRGFTIIELLVVIVVIGILAAVTVAAFNGVQRRSEVARVQSDLRQFAQLSDAYAVDNAGAYSSGLADLNLADDTRLQYTADNEASTRYYCITIVSDQVSDVVYHYDSRDREINEGACDGHTSGLTPEPVTTTWVQLTQIPEHDWAEAGISTDGSVIYLARDNSNVLYKSVDNGQNWTTQTISGSKSWYGMGVSGDGSKIMLAPWSSSPLYISTDSGVNWTTSWPSWASQFDDFNSIAMSEDGQTVISTQRSYSRTYVSTDGGATWPISRPVYGNFNVLAVADGTKDVFAFSGGSTYQYAYVWSPTTSTWTRLTAADNRDWRAVEVSADGQTIIAGAYEDGIYISKDGGTTFNKVDALPALRWNTVAVSHDGQHMLAGPWSSQALYQSLDGGDTWEQIPEAGNRSWSSVVISGDGSTFVAVPAVTGSAPAFIGRVN